MDKQKLKEALGTIIDLASENLLDEIDAIGPLRSVYEEQQEDMQIVAEFYESL